MRNSPTAIKYISSWCPLATCPTLKKREGVNYESDLYISAEAAERHMDPRELLPHKWHRREHFLHLATLNLHLEWLLSHPLKQFQVHHTCLCKKHAAYKLNTNELKKGRTHWIATFCLIAGMFGWWDVILVGPGDKDRGLTAEHQSVAGLRQALGCMRPASSAVPFETNTGV